LGGGTMTGRTLLQQNGDVTELRRLVANGRNVNERDADGVTALHLAAVNGNVEVLRVLVVELGADKDAKDANGGTPLHLAAVGGHVEAIKALEQLGAQIDAHAANKDTPLKLSIRHGQHQAAEVLRELERTARARKEAATSERAQQAAEHANRMAAELIEEEEREQAAKAEAQSKVRGVELSPVCGMSDAVSLVHGWVVSSEVPAAAFLWQR
jgi:ankyrin repeat protein